LKKETLSALTSLPFPLSPCIIIIRINPVGWVMKKLSEELLKENHAKVMYEIEEEKANVENS